MQQAELQARIKEERDLARRIAFDCIRDAIAKVRSNALGGPVTTDDIIQEIQEIGYWIDQITK
jgi:hypothetical protein